MATYDVYKTGIYAPEGGQHIASQIKYWGMKEDSSEHGYTDDNPGRLFSTIAKLFQPGDEVKTLQLSIIEPTHNSVELKMPLSDDEMKLLAIQVLDALKGKTL